MKRMMRLTVMLTLGFALRAAAAAVGQASEVRFTDYPALAGNAELVRRLMTPLAGEAVRRRLEKAGKSLDSRAVELGSERFALYVPATRPAAGYGLLVWVSPFDDAHLPPGWAPVLDRRGMMFVSAAKSGNRQPVLERRDPLAVIAAWSVERRYPVDPDRVYVAGWSGGSKVALRLALGYPDVFRGAVLNAGSEAIGGGDGLPVPPRDLMQRFQQESRLVYVTGGQDAAHLGDDVASIQSMRDWCQYNIDDHIVGFAGHDLLSPEALDRALAFLDAPPHPDVEKLAACRAAIDRELSSRLAEARALAAAGKAAEARSLLQRIDARFGGLAAPDSLELSR